MAWQYFRVEYPRFGLKMGEQPYHSCPPRTASNVLAANATPKDKCGDEFAGPQTVVTVTGSCKTATAGLPSDMVFKAHV